MFLMMAEVLESWRVAQALPATHFGNLSPANKATWNGLAARFTT